MLQEILVQQYGMRGEEIKAYALNQPTKKVASTYFPNDPSFTFYLVNPKDTGYLSFV